MNLSEVEEALQLVNNQLISEKELQYIYHVSSGPILPREPRWGHVSGQRPLLGMHHTLIDPKKIIIKMNIIMIIYSDEENICQSMLYDGQSLNDRYNRQSGGGGEGGGGSSPSYPVLSSSLVVIIH